MQRIYYRNAHYSQELAKHSIVSIRYSTDGYSFSIHHPYLELAAFRHQPFVADSPEEAERLTQEHIRDEELLQGMFQQVVVLAEEQRKMVVPDVVPAHCNWQLLAPFLTEYPTDELTHTLLPLAETGESLLTLISSDFHRFLLDRFPQALVTNSIAPLLIEALGAPPRSGEAVRLVANICDGYFDLLILRGKQLLLCNTFRHEAPTDILFYLFQALQALEIRPESTELRLCGREYPEGNLHRLLMRYLPVIHFAAVPSLEKSLPGEPLKSSFFFTLSTARTCVS